MSHDMHVYDTCGDCAADELATAIARTRSEICECGEQNRELLAARAQDAKRWVQVACAFNILARHVACDKDAHTPVISEVYAILRAALAPPPSDAKEAQR